jgi:hypothetical protein
MADFVEGTSGDWYGHKADEEGSLDLGCLWWHSPPLGWSSTAVRIVVVLLAIFIPGPNIGVLLAYVALGYLPPESEEF